MIPAVAQVRRTTSIQRAMFLGLRFVLMSNPYNAQRYAASMTVLCATNLLMLAPQPHSYDHRSRFT
jgi:hypothetical protein